MLKLAWTGRPFSYKGRYYDLENLVVAPEPFQKPHPMLYVAATSAAAAERAGRHGTHLHPVSMEPAFYEAYFRGLAEAGVDPKTRRISTGGSFTVTREDPDKVWERNKHHYFERWEFYTHIRDEMGDKPLPHGRADAAGPGAELYRNAELIGDPQTIIEALRARKEAMPWFTDVIHSGPASGIDIRTEVYQSLKMFAEEVMPTLKSW